MRLTGIDVKCRNWICANNLMSLRRLDDDRKLLAIARALPCQVGVEGSNPFARSKLHIAGQPGRPNRSRKLQRQANGRRSDVKEKSVTLGYRYVGGSPEKLAAFLNSDIAKWAEVAKGASLKK